MSPERVDLDQLRRQAKELRDAARAGDPAALRRVRDRAGTADPTRLSVAQLVIAREHGHASWPALVATVREAALDLAGRVAAFLRASVNGDNARAARLLAGDPRIAGFDPRIAIMLGDADRVRELIARDPGLALRPDPATGWTALLAACSSRWHRIDPARAPGLLAVAELLLDAGADPNTRTPPGHPQYCSTLFAAAGCADNPAITELLLRRGAVPDDHTVYLTAFHPDHACLRLLLAGGHLRADSTALAAPINTRDAEAVRLLLDAGADPNRPLPADLVAEYAPGELRLTPLHAAIDAGCPPDLVAALLEQGADPRAPDHAGRSPYRHALRNGRSDLVALLEEAGGADDTTAVDRLLNACLAADQEHARRIVEADPGLVGRLADDDRALLVQAAEQGEVAAVRLMLDLGFPAGIHRSGDGATALHAAGYAGAAGVVDLLIGRDADVEATDAVWGATPLAWTTVGSGEAPRLASEPDWAASVRSLIAAGAAVEGAWVGGKPPSPDVAELLLAHGVTPPDEPDR